MSALNACPLTPQPPAFLIDCDGTLCDTLPLWETLAVDDLTARGITPDADLAETLATLTLAEAADHLIRRHQLDLTQAALIAAWEARLANGYRHTAPAKPGVLGALQLLRERRLPAYAVTLSPRSLVDPLLRRTGVYPYLGGIISGHDQHLGKTDPALFEFAARITERPTVGCIVVEDSLFALETAHAAGFPTIAFYDPQHGEDHWQCCCAVADSAVRNWTEFFALITGSPIS